MSYDKTKTLELGFLGLRGKHPDRFYLRDSMETTYMRQNINGSILDRLGHRPI
jgi:hypothetical protein